ncbi:MAG: anaerobic ribonucleoside triphosphate reductase [Clostridiales bacterium]|nr:anaerobic ribonucleoside triphosphate reductase [Clostridiales bacterium]
MFRTIIKRDGREVPYDIMKIAAAIGKAMEASYCPDNGQSERMAQLVEKALFDKYGDNSPGVEDIQDVVENVLMENGYATVSKRYIIYRSQRSRARDMNSSLMRIYNEITFADAEDSDLKRDNANVDGDTAMGIMLKYGSEGAKDYYSKFILSEEQAKAHREGDIHIHDFDFYTLTTTCCQIDIAELFKGGFSTGHGFLREPNDITSYAALACIAIQSNQNDQHGGQSIPNFDYGLSIGVKKTFRKRYGTNFAKAAELLIPELSGRQEEVRAMVTAIETEKGLIPEMNMSEEFVSELDKRADELFGITGDMLTRVKDFAYNTAMQETDKTTYQAMEALIHNLNTMHSRAGAQTPFSSINYGTDTSLEGRMVVKNILLATEAGLGRGETPIFPIQIFKIKEGINYNPEDPNYDLFKLSLRCSAKRLFPNFSFIDAPFNLQYYKPGQPETEIAYMGCRTRVMGNNYDKTKEIAFGRGNLSFTSINMVRIAINAHGNIDWFFEELERKMDLVSKQLLDRYHIIAKKKVRNFPFLMGQGVWIGSKQLGPDDEVGEILKNGTLSIGFIGLAETLVALIGEHHGQSQRARNLGLDIVSFMRGYMDRKSKETGLNFTLLATPAEGLSGRFTRIDQKRFGKIPGVTDREYYTNSFHVPVYFPISAFEKIEIEAPYHALTNAGHISYVELDGDTTKNIEAFEAVVRCMHDNGVGYGSINHPVDSDPICGYTGIINDECPGCGRHEEDGDRGFERIRRITGYLVGTLDKFNNAKRAEERDRVKHNVFAAK